MANKKILVGDIHGEFEINKLSKVNFFQSINLDKKDYVIILGDFGLIFNNEQTPKEKYWLNWLYNKPWTTLFLDGNHENFPKIKELEIDIKKFDGTVGKINDKLYHLKRGEIYNICNDTLWVCGGAMSIDKQYRKKNISWWEEEIPSKEEMDHGIKNLEKCNWKVNYVLTHTLPREQIKNFNYLFLKDSDPTSSYFQFISKHLKFNHWYSGHFHEDLSHDKYTIVYNRKIFI